jgi:sulfur relay protein TusB/DsrH
VTNYVLVETRDPFDAVDCAQTYDLAETLAARGDTVTVVLAQNGVLPARATSTWAGRLGALGPRVQVLADDFSLRERGMGGSRLADGVRAIPIDALVDLIATSGCRVLWR